MIKDLIKQIRFLLYKSINLTMYKSDKRNFYNFTKWNFFKKFDKMLKQIYIFINFIEVVVNTCITSHFHGGNNFFRFFL